MLGFRTSGIDYNSNRFHIRMRGAILCTHTHTHPPHLMRPVPLDRITGGRSLPQPQSTTTTHFMCVIFNKLHQQTGCRTRREPEYVSVCEPVFACVCRFECSAHLSASKYLPKLLYDFVNTTQQRIQLDTCTTTSSSIQCSGVPVLRAACSNIFAHVIKFIAFSTSPPPPTPPPPTPPPTQPSPRSP